MTEIGIFGGTFSPVHLGHIHAAHAFYDELKLDRLIIVPSFCHPCKQSGIEFSAEERFEMLLLAFEGDSRNIEISDYEIEKKDVSYTADTLLHFKEKFGKDAHLTLLVGTDILLNIKKWKNAKQIFELARIAYIRREKSSLELENRISSAISELADNFGADISELKTEPYEISSTDIRGSVYDREIYLPDRVRKYINSKKRAKIISRVKNTVSEKRQEHIFSTEREALRLGELVCLSEADKERLSTASLLHDITKELSRKEHIELMKKLGASFGNDTLQSDKTLHAESGAYYAKELFPSEVDDKVFLAIFRHTTGAANMSILEKILYIADFTEETRTHEICKKERNYLYDLIDSGVEPEKAIDRTIIFSLENTISHLNETGGYIHPASVAALSYLKCHA